MKTHDETISQLEELEDIITRMKSALTIAKAGFYLISNNPDKAKETSDDILKLFKKIGISNDGRIIKR